MNDLLIDCDRCEARGPGCQDCVISALLREDHGVVPLDPVECRALGVLAQAGIVPPLRMQFGNGLKVV